MQYLGTPDGTGSDIEGSLSVDPDAPVLTDDQRLVVIEAGRSFAETGDWPMVGDVVRGLARRGLSTASRSAVQSLPSNVGFESDQALVLTAEGLALSGHGTEILDALVVFARTAAGIYLGEDEQPIIRSDDFTKVVSPDVADKAETLIAETEHFFPGEWRWQRSSGRWRQRVLQVALGDHGAGSGVPELPHGRGLPGLAAGASSAQELGSCCGLPREGLDRC